MAKQYDADALTPAQQAMANLQADSLKTRTLAGWLVASLTKRILANVGGIVDPLVALREAQAKVRRENPSLAVAAEDGFIADNDWSLLGLLIPSISAEVERGNYHRNDSTQSAPDVKIYRDLPTATIKGLEIFKTGTWNNDFYGVADLDEMVAAFDKVGFEPTVKAGHEDAQENQTAAKRVFGAPTLGYVGRIYRQGSKLLADLKEIPRKFADLIKAGAYRRVSAEVYFSYRRGDKTYPRVLKAVAFLGASIPAITDLKAVENLYKRNGTGAMYAYDEDENEFRIY